MKTLRILNLIILSVFMSFNMFAQNETYKKDEYHITEVVNRNFKCDYIISDTIFVKQQLLSDKVCIGNNKIRVELIKNPMSFKYDISMTFISNKHIEAVAFNSIYGDDEVKFEILENKLTNSKIYSIEADGIIIMEVTLLNNIGILENYKY